jgi:hypothetical protein
MEVIVLKTLVVGSSSVYLVSVLYSSSLNGYTGEGKC